MACMTSYTISITSFQCFSQQVSIDTRSVLSLVVCSPLNKVLYAEEGTYLFLFLGILTSCYSENHCSSVLWRTALSWS